jgi:hypothetical protein
MKQRYLKWLGVSALMMTFAAVAQVGHPAKGSWLGYYGPNDDNLQRMRLLIDWDNRELEGTINPGRNAVPMDKLTIDYDTWNMTIEATLPQESGSTAHFVATGKLENLGSWTNRRFKGTYTLGGESGEFEFLIN